MTFCIFVNIITQEVFTLKKIEKSKAISLREQGLSYNDILRKLSVSKGSLSYWLRDIKLNTPRQRDIEDKILENRAKFLEYNRIRSYKTKVKKEDLYNRSKGEISSITRQELKLIGIGLYWAEGYKANSWRTVSFANSDPGMISLMMKWFREICNVEEGKFRLKLQIHNKAGITRIERFWSEITGVSLNQFTKPTIKISKNSKLKRGNTLPWGTIQVRISDIQLLTKIRGWIKGLEALSSSPVKDVRFSI